MEALLVSILGKPLSAITEDDYNHILDEVGFIPRVVPLIKDVTA